ILIDQLPMTHHRFNHALYSPPINLSTYRVFGFLKGLIVAEKEGLTLFLPTIHRTALDTSSAAGQGDIAMLGKLIKENVLLGSFCRCCMLLHHDSTTTFASMRLMDCTS